MGTEQSKLLNANEATFSKKQLRTLPDSFLEDVHTRPQTLNLSTNFLESLPQLSKSFPNLRTILLKDNSFTSFPSSLSFSSNLTKIDIQSNKLTELSHAIYPSVTELILDQNLFEVLSHDFGVLFPSLQILSMTRNRLTFLPSINSDTLKKVNLESNWISKLSCCLNAPELTSINISYNCVDTLSFLPGTYMPNLDSIDLRMNQLSTFRIETCLSLRNLTLLYLTNNLLKELPDNLIDILPRLKLLWVGENKLERLPSTLVNMKNSISIFAGFNRLRWVPAFSVPSLSGLKVNVLDSLLGESPIIGKDVTFFTADFNLIDVIPPDVLNEAERLTTLSLRHNLLSEIPPSIQNCMITTLTLSQNNFSTFPSSLLSIKTLENLDLSMNRLSTIPPEIGSLIKLSRLNLSFNQITDVPVTLFRLPSLKQLILSNNHISDLPTPSQANVNTRALSSLERLLLSLNRFTKIPDLVKKCTSLKTLHLAGNKIKELDHTLLENLKQLTRLDLSFNEISKISDRFIPRVFRGIYIDLSHNALTTIPFCILQMNGALTADSQRMISEDFFQKRAESIIRHPSGAKAVQRPFSFPTSPVNINTGLANYIDISFNNILTVRISEEIDPFIEHFQNVMAMHHLSSPHFAKRDTTKAFVEPTLLPYFTNRSSSSPYLDLAFFSGASRLSPMIRCTSASTIPISEKPWFIHNGVTIWELEFKRRRSEKEKKAQLMSPYDAIRNLVRMSMSFELQSKPVQNKETNEKNISTDSLLSGHVSTSPTPLGATTPPVEPISPNDTTPSNPDKPPSPLATILTPTEPSAQSLSTVPTVTTYVPVPPVVPQLCEECFPPKSVLLSRFLKATDIPVGASSNPNSIIHFLLSHKVTYLSDYKLAQNNVPHLEESEDSYSGSFGFDDSLDSSSDDVDLTQPPEETPETVSEMKEKDLVGGDPPGGQPEPGDKQQLDDTPLSPGCPDDSDSDSEPETQDIDLNVEASPPTTRQPDTDSPAMPFDIVDDLDPQPVDDSIDDDPYQLDGPPEEEEDSEGKEENVSHSPVSTPDDPLDANPIDLEGADSSPEVVERDGNDSPSSSLDDYGGITEEMWEEELKERDSELEAEQMNPSKDNSFLTLDRKELQKRFVKDDLCSSRFLLKIHQKAHDFQQQPSRLISVTQQRWVSSLFITPSTHPEPVYRYPPFTEESTSNKTLIAEIPLRSGSLVYPFVGYQPEQLLPSQLSNEAEDVQKFHQLLNPLYHESLRNGHSSTPPVPLLRKNPKYRTDPAVLKQPNGLNLHILNNRMIRLHFNPYLININKIKDSQDNVSTDPLSRIINFRVPVPTGYVKPHLRDQHLRRFDPYSLEEPFGRLPIMGRPPRLNKMSFPSMKQSASSGIRSMNATRQGLPQQKRKMHSPYPDVMHLHDQFSRPAEDSSLSQLFEKSYGMNPLNSFESFGMSSVNSFAMSHLMSPVPKRPDVNLNVTPKNPVSLAKHNVGLSESNGERQTMEDAVLLLPIGGWDLKALIEQRSVDRIERLLKFPQELRFSTIGFDAMTRIEQETDSDLSAYHPEVKGCGLFGVFDGHKGPQAANFLSNHFVDAYLDSIREMLASDNVFPPDFMNLLLRTTLKKLTQKMWTLKVEDGSCALVMVVTPKQAFVANVGDCRAVLVSRFSSLVDAEQKRRPPPVSSSSQQTLEASPSSVGYSPGEVSPVSTPTLVESPILPRTISTQTLHDTNHFTRFRKEGRTHSVYASRQLTIDHKPTNKSERDYVMSVGGFINMQRRVNGVLAVARSMGDFDLHPAISDDPDMFEIGLCRWNGHTGPDPDGLRVLADEDSQFDFCGFEDDRGLRQILPNALAEWHKPCQPSHSDLHSYDSSTFSTSSWADSHVNDWKREDIAIVLACDGVFDVIRNDILADLVCDWMAGALSDEDLKKSNLTFEIDADDAYDMADSPKVNKGQFAKYAALRIRVASEALDSQDNISALVIIL
ncbi:putative Leucine-rich repeat protein soc-2 like protein [Blattamonas nauphoetae]|uniref:Leucine-rich repeat protein soc-2 like protein n=1 Tax=Blattamonas nauphoetae TaxID=2049346 RepID=A0ABQ9YMV7_9EUKA|nr:putative Leucine-rich repeat protein soc-2 like protein [Blattamonas nauphoetae]